MMSVASSTTPGIDENSCITPSMRTAVIAAPSIDESNTRRSALPIVVPKPRSNGCAWNLPYLSVNVSRSDTNRFGFWNPFQSILITSSILIEPRGGASHPRLLGVQLHDHLLLNGEVDVFPLRQRDHAGLQCLAIELEPGRNLPVASQIESAPNGGHLPALLVDFNFLSDTDLKRRNAYLSPRHQNVAVPNKLPRPGARSGQA